MKTTVYILALFFSILSSTLKAQTTEYRGQITVKQNVADQRNGVFSLDMDVSLCGLSVGRYQSLALMPMLRNGRDSLLLQPIIVNGANKQKMYDRVLAFKGKEAADAGAYVVVKNDKSLIRVVSYKKEISYRQWMKDAELVLVGEVSNYKGEPQQTFINVLTEKL